ncbi:transposase [Nostoc sp.]|uniref:transposase n=1 Tax=Nostoc sp. TaxID=1180 RepID=UPI002FFBD637
MALQAVVRSRSARADDDNITWESALQRQKKPKWTTLIIIDSQAVKNTCNAGVESKGFCHYKCTNGIKRHLAVDTLGLPFFTHCTKASVSDDSGLIEMLSKNMHYFRAKAVNIPKITILLDHGYHLDMITAALQTLYPQIMTKIRFQLAPKLTKAAKLAGGSFPRRALRKSCPW